MRRGMCTNVTPEVSPNRQGNKAIISRKHRKINSQLTGGEEKFTLNKCHRNGNCLSSNYTHNSVKVKLHESL